MSATAVIATLLFAAAAPDALVHTVASPAPTASYAELAEGSPREVEAEMRRNPLLSNDDPAALINLGAAYARAGNDAKAREAYMAAIASEDRFDVQLADGRWVDSRSAARLALASLAQRRAFAGR